MFEVLRADARRIWEAGVAAVLAERVVARHLERHDDRLRIVDEDLSLATCRRILVVGAGKAGAGMAAAVEAVLGVEIVRDKVTGWVNVPADCVRPLRKIVLHPARPAGVNEPTAEGVFGAAKIRELVSSMTVDDICLVLISGGGSALLPAPVLGISLADKLAVTRFLMHAGATIHELNTVRKPLSQLKGGGLAACAPAGQMFGLIISDVIGDPLDVIASGPTTASHSTPAEALAILAKFNAASPEVPQSIFDELRRQASRDSDSAARQTNAVRVRNFVIANNAVALRAAADCAMQLGYRVESLGTDNQGTADDAGRELATHCRGWRDRFRSQPGSRVCVLSGGEPVVQFTPRHWPRKGGRNQQLVLAAVDSFWNEGMHGIALLSGGTDGEDGPTDAAGAFADAGLLQTARQLGLEPHSFLAVQNAWPFFDACGGLIKTGPTHTNVMDLRVGLIEATDEPTP